MEENKKALEGESQTTDLIISQNTVKESFILYTEQKEVIESLSDEEAGKLFKGIFEYAVGNQPEFDNLLKLVFIPIRQQLDRNAQKYSEIKEKRRVAGAKGGKQKVANQANATFANQSLANQAVNDNVNVNVNVNDNVYLSKDKYVNNQSEKTNKNTTFKKPTIEEITNYCSERGNDVTPSQFYDYYSAIGWMVGKNKMKDWKAAIRNWERNNKTTKKEVDGWSL